MASHFRAHVEVAQLLGVLLETVLAGQLRSTYESDADYTSVLLVLEHVPDWYIHLRHPRAGGTIRVFVRDAAGHCVDSWDEREIGAVVLDLWLACRAQHYVSDVEEALGALLRGLAKL